MKTRMAPRSRTRHHPGREDGLKRAKDSWRGVANVILPQLGLLGHFASFGPSFRFLINQVL